MIQPISKTPAVSVQRPARSILPIPASKATSWLPPITKASMKPGIMNESNGEVCNSKSGSPMAEPSGQITSSPPQTSAASPVTASSINNPFFTQKRSTGEVIVLVGSLEATAFLDDPNTENNAANSFIVPGAERPLVSQVRGFAAPDR